MTDAPDDAGVPDSDPRHLDPAGDLADVVAESDTSFSLGDGADVEELREFVERAESGELGPADPGLEAAVRIARAVLDDVDGDGGGE